MSDEQELLRIADTMVISWEMGMHDEVFLFLAREQPLRAAAITTMILGLLGIEGKPAACHDFLVELTIKARETQTAI